MHATPSEPAQAFAQAAARLASRAILLAAGRRQAPSPEAARAIHEATRAAEALDAAARGGRSYDAALAAATATLEKATATLDDAMRPRPAYHLVRAKARA